MPETIDEILTAHRAGLVRPDETVARSYARIRAYADPALFITLRDEKEAVAEARALMREGPDGRPLYGIPVAVKDNIDVAGLPTTAACPAFLYRPSRDATCVARLRAAGAIVIGKTNLDQFATGLVGVRSPYGVPRNPFDATMIPGGSSSGSAVAVAAGLVPLSLGTDTAGSGRVPAGINNIVGLKPSVGLVSTAGVVPACRTLDCVSVFALTVDDAFEALSAMAGFDRGDPYSRHRALGAVEPIRQGIRVGVPKPGQMLFFGDRLASEAYETAIRQIEALGAVIQEFDIEPFYETARLLYDGPWVAERFITARSLIASDPESIHPVTRAIVLAGERATAVDAFQSFYRLEDLRRTKEEIFGALDAILLPTAPTAYSVDQVLADPVTLNSRLGTYTNFVNLLDLCGLAVPASFRPDGLPFGVTLLARAGQDALLASIGRAFHAATGLRLGAIEVEQPHPAAIRPAVRDDEIAIAVVGAHLSGMPLNGDLRKLGARLIGPGQTAPCYRLFSLANTTPPKPGLLRVSGSEGVAIELEVWALTPAAFGTFVNAIPAPLSIGSIALADGRVVKGFLAEAVAVADAEDISGFGGWRNFIASRMAAQPDVSVAT